MRVRIGPGSRWLSRTTVDGGKIVQELGLELDLKFEKMLHAKSPPLE